MNRMRLGLARLASLVGAILFWAWFVTQRIFSAIGATTVGEDWDLLVTEKVPTALGWLFSTPWYVPAGCAIALTAFLIWLSWPRKPEANKPDPVVAADNAPTRAAVPTSISIRFTGQGHAECLGEENIFRWFVVPLEHRYTDTGTGERKVFSNHFVFLVFDKPVPALQVTYDLSGDDPPFCEVKDFGNRHVILASHRPLNLRVITIKVHVKGA